MLILKQLITAGFYLLGAIVLIYIIFRNRLLKRDKQFILFVSALLLISCANIIEVSKSVGDLSFAVVTGIVALVVVGLNYKNS